MLDTMNVRRMEIEKTKKFFIKNQSKENTRKTYDNYITDYLDNVEVPNDLEQTMAYFEEQAQRYAKSTLIGKKAALSSFFDILEEWKLIPVNLFKTKTFKLAMDKFVEKAREHGHKPEPKHLKWHEIEQVLNRCGTDTLTGLRNRVIILMGVYGGMRKSEMENAKFTDIKEDLTGWSLKIKGKGGTDYIVIHERLYNAIMDLQKAYKEYGINSEYILISVTSRSIGKKVAPNAINRAVDRLTRGIKDITVHDLRHTCAVQMLSHGAELSRVAKHLRHKNIQTTMVYLESVDRHENSAVNKLPA